MSPRGTAVPASLASSTCRAAEAVRGNLQPMLEQQALYWVCHQQRWECGACHQYLLFLVNTAEDGEEQELRSSSKSYTKILIYK